MPPRAVPLSELAIAFCDIYTANGHNATAAYRQAGYASKHAGRDASRLMKRPAVIARLAELALRHVHDEACTLADHLRALALIRDGASKAGKWAAAASAEIARGRARGYQQVEPHGADAPPSPGELRPDFDALLRPGDGAPAPRGQSQREPGGAQPAPLGKLLASDYEVLGPQTGNAARVPGKRDSGAGRKRLSVDNTSPPNFQNPRPAPEPGPVRGPWHE